jgi:hypothetical protein
MPTGPPYGSKSFRRSSSRRTLGWHAKDIASVVSELQNLGVEFIRVEGFAQDELGIVTFPGGAQVAWFKDPDGHAFARRIYLKYRSRSFAHPAVCYKEGNLFSRFISFFRSIRPCYDASS